MGRIFLSYAREDRACAERLACVLENAGHSVWWDRRIGGGEEFGAEIEAELDRSDVVLVAWSKDSVKSRWVRDEAAVGGDRQILVPVTVDGCRPPMGFRQFHTLDLTAWKNSNKDARTAELLQSIERRLEAKATREEAPAAAVPRGQQHSLLPPRKALWAMAAALVLVVGAATAFYLRAGGDLLRGPLPKPTIALLPLTASSSDAELKDLLSQSRDSIAHAMSQSGVPVRLVDSAPQNRTLVGDFLLSGEFSRNANKIIATVRLDEAITGVTVLSQRFEAGSDGIRDLPDRIAAAVAGNLSNGATLQMLDRRHPMDPALLADLLGSFTAGDRLKTYQTAKRVAAKAPGTPGAQTAVAFFTGFALGQLPRDERPQALAEGRGAAAKSFAIEPEFGDIYASWCLLHSETRMTECEDHIRAGKRVDPDAPYLNSFLAGGLSDVGRFDEAVELTKLSYAHDPYDVFKIRGMLRMLEFSGDHDGARNLYQEAVRLFPENKASFIQQRLFGLIYSGQLDAIERLEKEVGSEALPLPYRHTGTLTLDWKSAAAVSRACPRGGDTFFMVRCLLALSANGDQDGAYSIANKLYPRRIGRTPEETERIWLDDPEGAGSLTLVTSPAAAPLRRDARYSALAQRVGLLTYWRSGRPPDFCRKNREPICTQLLKGS